ncbi:MAG: aminopeptidase P N-terminal domain-containing protein [Gammaproteobacteria bacterium]|nr:aminopeptidase P N-terminal domain-containing protein [Gammaproteobacteria bacterium]
MIHQKRRKELLSRLDDNALVIVCTNSELQRNADCNFPFRPNSSFWYLTGFTEPDAIAVFSKKNYSIFLRPKDKTKEIWNGKRLGAEAAPEVLLADNAYSIELFAEQLDMLIDDDSVLYYDNTSTNILSEDIASSEDIHPLLPYLSEMRLIKDDAEIENMQVSADLAANAHAQAMTNVKPGMFEYEIAALFDAEFKKNNSTHAYTPIVAGGVNACVLHYIENNEVLKDGDLLLIDAGCETEGYASDITRTFPVGGRFSEAQKQIYSIVLDAQKGAINRLKPGEPVNKAHDIACSIISNGLIELGIISDDLPLNEFYMHNTGHWLGLDVHDCGQYKLNDAYRHFEAGMVMTVEPGIYIRKNDKIDRKYWNIGIRIEDDVLITESGNTVLTQSLVKEIDDIERLMNRK